MLLLVTLVVVALSIIAAAVACAWRHGSLHPSDQELVDVEFERIVSALARPGR